MSVRHKLLFILLLIAAGLSCRAGSALFTAPATEPVPTVLAVISPAVSPTQQPPTGTPTPQPTFTPTYTPTSTPTITPSATLPPTPSPIQLGVFEGLWSTIRDDYLYPDFNGLNWDAIHAEYRHRIESGLYNVDFYNAMVEMVQRLNDDHSFFLSPEEASNEDSEYAGHNDFVGIGILTIPVPERDRVSIVLVFPDSPAQNAGLEAHDSILAIDGKPVLDENGFRRDLLRGPEGTQVEITVQTPGEEARSVTLTRSRVTGSIPVPWSSHITPHGKRIGYMLIPSFADETIDDQVADNLKRLAAEGTLDGLILDNRQNSGGADNIARGVLSYFTSGLQGYFIDRFGTQRPLSVSGDDIEGSANLPLIVLVGPDTVSFGEIFSGILQNAGRAYLIGEVTN
jgi:C-terminal peptidase prc